MIAGVPFDPTHKTFWTDIAYSVGFLVLVNLVLSVTNIIGPRTFRNFVVGRYHTPVEENRFVLFVDIVGSTGLAERLGGVASTAFSIERFACSPSRSWIIAAKSSTMSATR